MSSKNSVCFGPSKTIYTLLNNKIIAHNEKYPRARLKTEQIRQLFALNMNKGLDYALAKVNLVIQISADTHSGKITKIVPTSNVLFVNKLAEVRLEITPTSEQIQAAMSELKELQIDKIKAEDLYFEADETHVPIWNQLI
jgi:hypothetical protein